VAEGFEGAEGFAAALESVILLNPEILNLEALKAAALAS
jgi:hypothetical protein